MSNYTLTDVANQIDTKICSLHFVDSDYYQDSNRLKPNAVPNMINCKTVREQLEEKISNLKSDLAKARKIKNYKDRKISDMKNVNTDLKLKSESEDILHSKFEGLSQDIIDCLLENQNKNVRDENEIHMLAKTLYLHSPSAYESIQSMYSLPNQKEVISWINSTDSNPGILSNMIYQIKTEVCRNPKSQLVNLVIDELRISPDMPYNPSTGRYEGQVDYGLEIQHGETDMATRALVIMAVSITADWKYPIAYLFTSCADCDILKDIIVHCIEVLHKAGVDVLSVTTDGYRANWLAMKKLGCQLSVTNLQSYFTHPSNSAQKVYFVPNVSHMTKLLTNLLAELKIFKVEKTDKEIKWEFVENLMDLQENMFKDNFLCSSAAKALDYHRNEGSNVFKGSEETSVFMRHMDKALGLLNPTDINDTACMATITRKNYVQVKKIQNFQLTL